MSVPELEAIKALVKKQPIADLREQEFLRLIWLRAKLSKTNYDPRYPDSSLVPATIKGMQAQGWGDKQILGAVTGENALENKSRTETQRLRPTILAVSLVLFRLARRYSGMVGTGASGSDAQAERSIATAAYAMTPVTTQRIIVR